jgi:tetratricopeptide (TPR) repeat protein/uncharacterized protein YhhL (DUF1145 family)
VGKSSNKKRKASEGVVADKSSPGSSHESLDARFQQIKPAHKIRYLQYGLAGLVSFITFIVYLSSLQNEFLNWDDPLYVSENPHLRLLNLTFFKWAAFDFHAANWHPLTWLSHALDYAVWGLNPLGHHLTSNILHAINTFLVVLLVVRLLEAVHDSRFTIHNSRFTLVAAATTGLLFGLHPLHVESVAWVAERKDLLCALFFLLSILMYMKYVGTLQRAKGMEHGVKNVFGLASGALLSALCFFILALLSKPMAVTLPAVLLILDWYPFKRFQSVKSFWPVCIEKLPFIALSLGSSFLTILAQKAGGAMTMMTFLPLSARLLVAAKSLMAYLWNMLLPLELNSYYPYPQEASLSSPVYIVSILLVTGITILCFSIARKQKVWLAIWGYYVVTLIPVIGIVQVGGQAMADRYTYLPSLGPFVLIGLVAAWALTRVHTVRQWDLTSKLVTGVAAIFLFFPLAYLTVNQIHIWKDSFTLWNYVIERQPLRVPLAYTNRGLAFMNMGRLERAIEDYDQVIALDANDYKAYANRGVAFDKLGQLDKALANMDKAIALNPVFFEAYNDRGSVFEKMGQRDKAIENFSMAITLNPFFDEAYYNRGIAYGEAGLFDKSIESFNKALEIDPRKVDAYVSRGISYGITGQHDRALQDFNEAIRINTNHEKAYFNRGNLYFITGKKELALSDFRKACALGDQGGCNVIKRYDK